MSVQSNKKFPSHWKTAYITPVYKKSNKVDVKNYRPMSILPCLPKVFKCVLDEQLHVYVESNCLLSKIQHGFHKGHSCQFALISLSNTLFANRSEGLVTAVAMLDFSKAFDTLDHDVLLSSLHHIGISNNTVEWFRTYFSDRLQHVRYANELSDALLISYGVPEGSVHGPLLYIIYVNDLLHQLPDGCAIAYADDITLLTSGPSAQSAANSLQQLVTTVESWSAGHSLCLNYTKCYTMFVCPLWHQPYAYPAVLVGGHSISPVTKLTILGVIFSSVLSWQLHVYKVRDKVVSRQGVIRCFGQALDIRTRLRLYNGFIKPYFMFCVPVWGNVYCGIVSQMDNVITRCLRAVTNNNTAAISNNTFSIFDIGRFRDHVFLLNFLFVFPDLQLPAR